MQLLVQIVRFVEEHQPPIVACELVDAAGSHHTFIDKVAGFSSQWLPADSAYPQPGTIRCHVLAHWQDDTGRRLVRVSTERPDGIESTEGVSEFVVLSSQIVSAEATIAELEKKATECEEKAKAEPDRIAARLRHSAEVYREWIAALKSGRWKA